MSKQDYYATLGVAKDASEDDIKKAFRKLSSKHHPDKHPEADKAKNEAIFKEVKEAYDTLSDPQKRAAYDQYGHDAPQPGGGGFHAGGMDINEIFSQMRRAHSAQFHQFKQVAEYVARVTLKDAYDGFEVSINLPDGTKPKLKVPGKTPDGFRMAHEVNDKLTIVTITKIEDPNFGITSAVDCPVEIRVVDGVRTTYIPCGDIETVVDIDAIDLILGCWTQVPDYLGAKYDVRIPSGFNPHTRLKVKGKGYYGWMHEKKMAAAERSDLYVRVNPIFTPPAAVDHAKAVALEQLSRPKVGS